LRRQRQTLQMQLSRLHDLLEQGIYSPETFLARQRELTERLSALESQLAAQKPPTPSLTDRLRQSLPRVRAPPDPYPLPTPPPAPAPSPTPTLSPPPPPRKTSFSNRSSKKSPTKLPNAPPA